MLERLGDRQVRVGQLDVLADETDLEGRLGCLDPLDQCAPAVEVGGSVRVAESELAHDQPSQPRFLEEQRDLVDRLGGLGRDDGVGGDVGEEGDLLADLVTDRSIGAEDDDIGLDADAAQLLDRVLGGLRLELARGGQLGQERHVDIQHVGAADVLAHLADRLEERQALDVADGPADLDDDDIRVAVT